MFIMESIFIKEPAPSTNSSVKENKHQKKKEKNFNSIE